MYQTINLYYTKDQPCTANCTTTSASNMHQHLYHNKCINHAPTPVPCTSTINHVHQHHAKYQSCTIPCINHVHQQCTSTPVPTMYLNHVPYHLIMPYTIYHRIYQASIINGVTQPSTNITKRCISCMCFHIPSVLLNNVSISMIGL
jgi:hypothetical protein